MERKNEKKKIACVILCGVVDSSISIIIRSIDLKKIRKMFTVCYFFAQEIVWRKRKRN